MAGTKLLVLTLVASLCAFSAAAWAADTNTGNPSPDTLKVDYFDNAHTSGAPDATLRFVHPGTTYANLCADIYVFDTNEEMSECCSCELTPNGYLALSVNKDLTSNPLTGVILTTGVIKVVSTGTTSGGCPVPDFKTAAVPALRAWETHVQSSNFTLTEDVTPDATLSWGELGALRAQCQAIVRDGSGHGICGTAQSVCNN